MLSAAGDRTSHRPCEVRGKGSSLVLLHPGQARASPRQLVVPSRLPAEHARWASPSASCLLLLCLVPSFCLFWEIFISRERCIVPMSRKSREGLQWEFLSRRVSIWEWTRMSSATWFWGQALSRLQPYQETLQIVLILRYENLVRFSVSSAVLFIPQDSALSEAPRRAGAVGVSPVGTRLASRPGACTRVAVTLAKRCVYCFTGNSHVSSRGVLRVSSMSML